MIKKKKVFQNKAALTKFLGCYVSIWLELWLLFVEETGLSWKSFKVFQPYIGILSDLRCSNHTGILTHLRCSSHIGILSDLRCSNHIGILSHLRYSNHISTKSLILENWIFLTTVIWNFWGKIWGVFSLWTVQIKYKRFVSDLYRLCNKFHKT